jgi:outer membrane protein
MSTCPAYRRRHLLAGLAFRALATVSVSALACSASLTMVSSTAAAQSITDALANAYRTSSKLDAARAALRAVDETVSQANSNYRPVVNGTASVGRTESTSRSNAAVNNVAQTELHPRSYGVSATQPIFRGGQIVNTVRRAEADVRAQREVLRGVEQQVLLDSATSYLDVIRDGSIVKLRESNVNVLAQELKATRERFAVGEVTRTDVAQSEASLAAARSALDLAKSNLQTSRAGYERNIGTPPGNLLAPKGLERFLPKTLDEAISISSRENPNVVNALYAEQSARHAIDIIWGQLLPTASVTADFNRNYDSASNVAQLDVARITGNVTVPIYSNGSVNSQVRQAKQTHISRIQQIEQQRTEVKALVVSAWSSLIAARAQLVSDNAQVASAQTALTGVREEERVGQRTLLDVLNAEQVILNARVAVVGDQRNIAVAAYSVMSAVGRLNIQELGGVESVYDPEVHYHEVRRQAWGVSVTRPSGRVDVPDKWDTHTTAHTGQDDAKSWKPKK